METVEPVSGPFGALIGDLDLTTPLDAATAGRLRAALGRFRLLRIEAGEVTPERLTNLGRCFGQLEQYPWISPLPGSPWVIEINKEPDETVNFGGMWHSDLIYQATPSSATLVGMVDTPETGGDTLFADTVAAASSLPPELKAGLVGLWGWYADDALEARLGTAALVGPEANRTVRHRQSSGDGPDPVRHPVLAASPSTGETTLFFSRPYLLRFDGLRDDEGDLLAERLEAHITRDANVVRLSWKPGTIAVWDNYCVSHRALNDYHGHRRRILRVSVAGTGLRAAPAGGA